MLYQLTQCCRVIPHKQWEIYSQKRGSQGAPSPLPEILEFCWHLPLSHPGYFDSPPLSHFPPKYNPGYVPQCSISYKGRGNLIPSGMTMSIKMKAISCAKAAQHNFSFSVTCKHKMWSSMLHLLFGQPVFREVRAFIRTSTIILYRDR